MLKHIYPRSLFILAVFITFGLTAPIATAQLTLDDFDLDFLIDNEPMSEGEIKRFFKGQTHKGAYQFDRDGHATRGFEETTYADGRVLHIQGEETLNGSWRIADGHMCYTYERVWSEEICFDMYQVNNCIYHYQRSVGGLPRTGWTARTNLKGERAQCDIPIV